MTYVLGAPGSGKSTIASLMPGILRSHVILDWDAFMPAASELAKRDLRRSPSTWPSYRRLVRAVVDTIQPTPLVVFGVCTPDELEGWPIDAWTLLDCSDDERQQRLGDHLSVDEIRDALADATQYRSLDLPVIDTTGKTPQAVANEVAHRIRQQAL